MLLEQALTHLPWIIVIWTSITLCWGLYMGITYTMMLLWMRTRSGFVKGYDLHLCVICSLNAILAAFLWNDTVSHIVSGAILVVNVFYTSILIETTLEVIHWNKLKVNAPILPTAI